MIEITNGGYSGSDEDLRKFGIVLKSQEEIEHEKALHEEYLARKAVKERKKKKDDERFCMILSVFLLGIFLGVGAQAYSENQKQSEQQGTVIENNLSR